MIARVAGAAFQQLKAARERMSPLLTHAPGQWLSDRLPEAIHVVPGAACIGGRRPGRYLTGPGARPGRRRHDVIGQDDAPGSTGPPARLAIRGRMANASYSSDPDPLSVYLSWSLLPNRGTDVHVRSAHSCR